MAMSVLHYPFHYERGRGVQPGFRLPAKSVPLLLQPAGIPAVTLDIEAGIAPEEIIRRNHLDALLQYFEACGCEALVLGCTHYPYVADALRAYTDLPLLDPAEEMLRLLLAP